MGEAQRKPLNGDFMWSHFMRVTGVLLCLWATTAQGAGFAGHYRGVMANVPGQMVLVQKGATLTGTLQLDNGDHYQLTGTVSGNAATGKARYAKDNSSWGFVLNTSASGVVWRTTVFGVPRADTETAFTRQGATPYPSSSASAATASGKARGVQDRQLVGSWTNTRTYVSGDFSSVSEKYVQFRADGTFTFRKGRLVGGGNSGSFDSGAGTNTTRGRWQTQNEILYYLVDGTNSWEAYGRYGFSGDGRTMRFVFGNGNTELWER